MAELMAGGIFRRGQAWFVRVHIPRERWRDVGRIYRSKTGEKRDIVRTLETTDRREALRRRDPAVAAIREDVDSRLRAAGLQPLAGDWTADWGPVAAARREQLRTADATPDPFDDEGDGWTPRALVRDKISEEAQELYETQGADAANAYWAVATGGSLTVQEAADRWLAGLEAGKQNRQQTINGHRAALELLGAFLKAEKGLPALSAVALPIISRRIANDFVTWRQTTNSAKTKRPVSPKTIQRELSSFNGLWRWALRGDHAAQNPWTDQASSLPDPRRARHAGDDREDGKRPYSPAELVALLKATGKDWSPNGGGYGATLWDMLRLGLLTGCRADELASLRVADFVDGTSIRIRMGKTGNARRTLPLHAAAQRVLVERLAQLPDTAPTAPLFPEIPAQGPDQKRGKMLTTRFLPAMRRILKDAGLETTGEVDLHSLRRSFAQHVRNAMQEDGGVDTVLLGALMGHSESTLALKVYGRNTLPQHLRQAVDAMGEKGLPEEVRQALEETAGQRPRMVRFVPVER